MIFVFDAINELKANELIKPFDSRKEFQKWHESKYRNMDYRHLEDSFLHARVALDFDIWLAAIESVSMHRQGINSNEHKKVWV
jgi:hypothetical protein